MLHDIQRTILETLAGTITARYSEIKPARLSSNSFSYHLAQTVARGYVYKLQDGSYSLSDEGKRYITTEQLPAKQPPTDAVIMIAVRNREGMWLLRRWRHGPRKGKIGFIEATPRYGSSLLHTADEALRAQTGLNGRTSYLSSGFISLTDSHLPQQHLQISLVGVTVHEWTGFISRDDTGNHYWQTAPLFNDSDMLPFMGLIGTIAAAEPRTRPHFFDQTIPPIMTQSPYR